MLLEAEQSTDCGVGQEGCICQETPDPPPNIRRLWECSGQHHVPASEQIDGPGDGGELIPAPYSQQAHIRELVNVASARHMPNAAGSPRDRWELVT